MTNNHQELELMSRAARLYYQDDLTQQEVAAQLGISRPAVSRLLSQARREGVVQIHIVDPLTSFADLEARLVETFQLRNAVVVAGEGLNSDLLRRRLGYAAAAYLRGKLRDQNRVGIGWGRSLHEVVEAFDSNDPAAIQVLPLIGGVGQVAPSFQVNKLAERLANSFHGDWQPFYVPAFVAEPAAIKGLLSLPDVARVMQSWSELDMALVGVGHFALQRQSSMLFASYMTDVALREMEQFGAVGDICGRFFDIDGRSMNNEPGIIGISLDELRVLDNVVGIAGGPEKVMAILGALRGGYLNVLLTDNVTAQNVLERHAQYD